ncbi:serine protein kinase RIO [Candidatus Woesearchaeota archaeon]|nr:serine protein kinase RIO [Candidatus Woesearchaeota archaeon]
MARRITREKFKVEKTVFDNFTIQNLRKLESEGFLEIETLIPLFMGKEANVFIAEGKNGKVAVKIYRLENCDFNRMFDYIKFDPRFMKIKRRKRDVILTWVKREYRNLLKAREHKVRVPTIYCIKHNILVMELIGEPSMKIKDDIPKNPSKFYKDLILQMKRLLKAELVHGDLSKFNVLNFNEKPVLIDFSQSIVKSSIRAVEYFERDIKNINMFFTKLGLKEKELKTIEDFKK